MAAAAASPLPLLLSTKFPIYPSFPPNLIILARIPPLLPPTNTATASKRRTQVLPAGMTRSFLPLFHFFNPFDSFIFLPLPATSPAASPLPSSTPIPPPPRRRSPRGILQRRLRWPHLPGDRHRRRSRDACSDAKILFINTATGMESATVPTAGYDYAPIPRARLARPFLHPVNLLLLPFHLLCSVAAPVWSAAALSGIKIAIQEQNSIPGLTDHVVAAYVERIFLVFNASVKHFPKKKCLVCGNPVRLSLRRYTSKAVARSHFFPEAGSDKAQVVLVLGGSAGDGAIDVAVPNMYHEKLMEHQTGAEGYSAMEGLVRNNRRLPLTP